MKIALAGAEPETRLFLTNEICKLWGMYTLPEFDYTKFMDPRVFSGEDGNQVHAWLRYLTEALIAEAILDKGTNTVFYHCALDVYAQALAIKKTKLDGESAEIPEDLLNEIKVMLSQVWKKYDIIFYCPYQGFVVEGEETPEESLVELLKSTDKELVNIVSSYERGTSTVFPSEDCPAVITLQGPPDTWPAQISLYLKEDGVPFQEEDGSLIADLK